MSIYVIKPGAPSIDRDIQAQLDQMSPRVFLRWNNAYRKSGRTTPDGTPTWEGRWEIWCELRETNHPDATNERADSDLWNTEAQCWMRKLQTYNTAEGEFAPADQRLIWGLQLADGWKNRRLYEEHIEEPYNEAEEARLKMFKEAAKASSDYYRKMDSPIIGRHANSGWRHRIR